MSRDRVKRRFLKHDITGMSAMVPYATNAGRPQVYRDRRRGGIIEHEERPIDSKGVVDAPSGSPKRDSIPEHVFLIPGQRKYPVKTFNRTTGRWEYNADRLRAAISVANRQGRSDISARASRILKQLNTSGV